jgi:hypothetical protein
MAPATAGKLSFAARRIPKCTYTPLKIDSPGTEEGAAIVKYAFAGNLGLHQGEVQAAVRLARATGPSLADSTVQALQSFEGSPPPSLLPPASTFRAIPTSELKAFGQALLALRKTAAAPAPQSNGHDPALAGGTPIAAGAAPAAGLAAGAGAGPEAGQAVVAPAVAAPAVVASSIPLAVESATGLAAPLINAMAMHQYQVAHVAVNNFEQNVAVAPIGMLNLERIEMTPVGVERGELLATIPLAPLEQTAVTHKEWSVTSQEFSSIVTDSLENVSATGVTENTELAQSVSSQATHSSQFNINSTVSGGYGPVTVTLSTGFGTQDQSSQSASDSRKHAVATTRSASSRVKQEHKVTITTSTVTGTSETSTRILQNPSSTDPIRIDYFSLIRKWHVGLYRYGLRLTYDIAIPEPGATMRRIYAEIDDLRSQLTPFDFPYAFSDITTANWAALSGQYGVTFPGPPEDPSEASFTSNYTRQGDTTLPGPTYPMELDIPDGYRVTQATAYPDMDTGGSGSTLFSAIYINRLTGTYDTGTGSTIDLPFLVGTEGRQFLLYSTAGSPDGYVEVDLQLALTDAGRVAWQQQAWNALYNAAQAQWYAQQQDIEGRIATLQSQLDGVDTLTLRREESEEIMKGVLRWLLGPTFEFMPKDVIGIFESSSLNGNIDLLHGAATDFGDGLDVTTKAWTPMFLYEEMVKFINGAIEWENVLYFLYSYFWDVPPAWEFVRQIRHPDLTRQAFLRAGSARVVLTVRKGWEQAWVNFVEAGGFGETLLPGHPYLTIAQQIEAYDETNYPGIPPANPGGGPLVADGDSVASTSSATLQPSASPVTIEVGSSDGFIVGYTAVIDTWDSKDTNGNTLQENQTITAVPNGTHITVAALTNAHDGSKTPFPVMQAGEKGQLIAEWFEYTPTSGTDIAVTSNLADIA